MPFIHIQKGQPLPSRAELDSGSKPGALPLIPAGQPLSQASLRSHCELVVKLGADPAHGAQVIFQGLAQGRRKGPVVWRERLAPERNPMQIEGMLGHEVCTGGRGN